MKKLFCMAVAALLFFPAYPSLILAADPSEITQQQEPATKIEKFMSKKGSLYVKTFHAAGILSGLYGQYVKTDSLIIQETGKDAQKIRGLRIEVHEGGRFEKSHTSFLDIEEVESLSQALEYMITLAENFQKDDFEDYREVIFDTKGDFSVGFYQKNKEFQAFAKSGRIGESRCFFSINSLTELKADIERGLVSARK